MHTKIESTWWFLLLSAPLAALAAARLMESAGIHTPYRCSTWVLFVFCLFCLQRLPASLDLLEPGP